MKFLVSLLGLGTTFGGIFMGSIQQNVFRTGKPYIDVLFDEIEKDIRKFSEENPLTATIANEIKQGPNSSSLETQTRRKRRDTGNDKKASKNTLGVWTDIWVGLLSDYISNLWMSNNKVSTDTLDEKSKNFSNEQKEKAIKCADISNKDEKERFKKQVKEKEKEIESIYERMKDFILKIEFPATYKYNTNDSNDGPYENYIRKILEK